jgi:DHA1 family bicyclomycin/chloramphenicol resistance-like MFS transporter
MPITTSLALSGQGRVAGSASAVIGLTQFGFGALAGVLVSVLHDGTARPMALLITGCGLAGLLARRWLLR